MRTIATLSSLIALLLLSGCAEETAAPEAEQDNAMPALVDGDETSPQVEFHAVHTDDPGPNAPAIAAPSGGMMPAENVAQAVENEASEAMGQVSEAASSAAEAASPDYAFFAVHDPSTPRAPR